MSDNGDSHSDADSYVVAKRRKTTRSRSASRSRRRYSRSPAPKRHRSKYSRSASRSPSPYARHRSSGGDRDRSRRKSRYDRSVSPMSQRRRHVGNREDPETSKCIGVFGLSLYTQERDLREAFSRYGPLDDVQVVYDHQTGRSRGFAFLYFKNLADAVEAKDRMPGTEIDGRKIRVDYSITRRAHTPTPGIYLGKEGGDDGRPWTEPRRGMNRNMINPPPRPPPRNMSAPRYSDYPHPADRGGPSRRRSRSPDYPTRRRGYWSRSRSRSYSPRYARY